MEAPGSAGLVSDLAEGVAPVDLRGQIAALAAEQCPRLGHALKEHDYLCIQRLQQAATLASSLSDCCGALGQHS